MDKSVYETIFHLEHEYWWYVGLRDLVQRCIETAASGKQHLRLLDAGCGTGKLLEMNAAGRPVGLDLSPEALAFCRLRKLDRLVRASVSDLPFSDSSFDLVVSLDVLYHAGVEDDTYALKEFARALDTGGIVILNLPAFDFLRGAHDVAIHTRRRYRSRELRDKLARAGLTVERISYRNTVLFPVAVAARLLSRPRARGESGPESDLRALPRVVNRVLTWILLAENRLIRLGFRFPFGLSVFCVARKG